MYALVYGVTIKTHPLILQTCNSGLVGIYSTQDKVGRYETQLMLWVMFFFMQVEIMAPDNIADACPLKSFKFLKTKQVPTNTTTTWPSKGNNFLMNKTGSLNTRTPWW